MILCNKKQARRDVHIKLICIADVYNGYVLDQLERCDHIEYERQIQNDDK